MYYYGVIISLYRGDMLLALSHIYDHSQRPQNIIKFSHRREGQQVNKFTPLVNVPTR